MRLDFCSPANILQADILIVDDKATNVLLLERMLHKAGYVSVTSTTMPDTVCELYRNHRYDLILLDLQMPGMSGFEIMERLQEIEPDGYLSVLVITAQPEHKVRALQIGAKDFISKPFDMPEVLARIHNMLEVRLLHRQSMHYNAILEQTVQELRSAQAGLRDSETALSKEKKALDHYVLQLRLANEHLTVATVEAQALAAEIELARAHMAHLAQHDALTDLPNRVLLNDRMIQAMALAQRQGKQLAVMFLDLDHFKHVNDTWGHAAGDELLQSVAKRLRGSVRSSDTVCRQGGDEFVILLAEVEDSHDAAHAAQKILAALAVPHVIGGVELTVTMSIGISVYPDDGQDVDTLIQRADLTMYCAKESGRNNYRFFKK
ncbi:MAG: GGDEF domain-containing response regulator [Burkholderiales bacterium]